MWDLYLFGKSIPPCIFEACERTVCSGDCGMFVIDTLLPSNNNGNANLRADNVKQISVKEQYIYNLFCMI